MYEGFFLLAKRKSFLKSEIHEMTVENEKGCERMIQEKKVYSFRLTQDDIDKLDLLVEAEQERITNVIHEMRLDISAKPLSRTDIIQKLIQTKYDHLTND